MKTDSIISTIFAGSMTAFTALFGGWDLAFKIFLIFITCDIVTGVIKGIALKDYSSRKMREGVMAKFGYLIIIVLATQIDLLMPTGSPLIRTLVIYFYIFTEASSIIENLGQIGVPIPVVIADKLSVLKDIANGEKESKEEKEEANS